MRARWWRRSQRLGDLFAKELRDYAESKSSANVANGRSSGAKATRTAAQPISAKVMGEMMAYYKVHNHKFANPMKITRVCRSFQAKARAAAAAAAADRAATENCVGNSANENNDGEQTMATRTPNDPEGWVDMMYAALAEKSGGIGPRDIPHSGCSSTASCGYVPVETTATVSSKTEATVNGSLGSVPLQELNERNE